MASKLPGIGEGMNRQLLEEAQLSEEELERAWLHMTSSQNAMLNWISGLDSKNMFAATRNLHWQNSIPILKYIAESPICDQANAAWIFFYAQPEEYIIRSLQGEKPYGDDGSFAIALRIVHNWRNKIYSERQFNLNENHELQTHYLSELKRVAYDPLLIPDDMVKPFVGGDAHYDDANNPQKVQYVSDLFADLGAYCGL